MKRIKGILVAIFMSLSSTTGAAVIFPSDDGSIYSSGAVVTNQYLMASGSIQGVVEFRIVDLSPNASRILFEVNPYGLPLWDKTVEVFGYASNDGVLTVADYDAGVLLGVLHLHDDLGFGEHASFDVTTFVNSLSSPYVGFNLRTDGTDVFSSLEVNYGSPARLAVSEPSMIALFLMGLVGFHASMRSVA